VHQPSQTRIPHPAPLKTLNIHWVFLFSVLSNDYIRHQIEYLTRTINVTYTSRHYFCAERTMTPEKQSPALNLVRQWGFRGLVGSTAVVLAWTVGAQAAEFGSSDSQSTEALPHTEPTVSGTTATESTIPSETSTVFVSQSSSAVAPPTEAAAPSPSELVSPSVEPTAIATYDDVVIPSGLPTEVPTAQPPTVEKEISIISANIYYNTDDDHPEWSKQQWQDRLRASAALLRKFTLIGVQEAREPQSVAMEHELGENFRKFPEKYDTYTAQNPIYYDNTVYEFLNGWTIEGPHVADPGSFPDSTTLVKLRLRGTDKILFMANNHQTVGNSIEAQQSRNTNGNTEAGQFHDLLDNNPGAIAFATMDSNSDSDPAAGDNQAPLNGDPHNAMICKMAAQDLFDVYMDYEKLIQKSSGDCPSWQGGGVDRIFSNAHEIGGVKITYYQRGGAEYDAPQNGSDVHPFVFAKYTITAAAQP
jgi:hypothetical protein